MKTLVIATLKSQLRNKSIAFRTFPFVALILFIFAFAFDPANGFIEKVSPGIFWLSVLFGSTFIFTSQMENKNESKFLSSFGIDQVTIFFSRVVVNIILIFALAVFSGVLTIALYSPPVAHVAILLLIICITTVALSAVGAIYTPLVARAKDAGQLLSLLVIPVLIPVFLAAIKATENIFDLAIGDSWSWIGLIAIFSALYLSAGALAASSIYD
jgi:heme exporter protein B